MRTIRIIGVTAFVFAFAAGLATERGVAQPTQCWICDGEQGCPTAPEAGMSQPCRWEDWCFNDCENPANHWLQCLHQGEVIDCGDDAVAMSGQIVLSIDPTEAASNPAKNNLVFDPQSGTYRRACNGAMVLIPGLSTQPAEGGDRSAHSGRRIDIP